MSITHSQIHTLPDGSNINTFYWPGSSTLYMGLLKYGALYSTKVFTLMYSADPQRIIESEVIRISSLMEDKDDD